MDRSIFENSIVQVTIITLLIVRAPRSYLNPHINLIEELIHQLHLSSHHLLEVLLEYLILHNFFYCGANIKEAMMEFMLSY
jgi:hypothetical protein